MIPDFAVEGAISEAREIAEQMGSYELPLDVEKLARHLGVAEIGPALIAADGYIGRRKDGRLVIRYNDESPRQRKRFTIAHEIGHLLLAKHSRETLLHRNRDGSPDSQEELLANRIASEILMPTRLFRAHVNEFIYRGMRTPWKIVACLKDCFDVAESAAALRILELDDAIAILFRINLGACGTTFPFDGSKGVAFKLSETPICIAGRLWSEHRAGERFHRVGITSLHGIAELKCEGRLRTLKSRRGESTQYWALGWHLF